MSTLRTIKIEVTVETDLSEKKFWDRTSDKLLEVDWDGKLVQLKTSMNLTVPEVEARPRASRKEK